jgi:hypothetical protein
MNSIYFSVCQIVFFSFIFFFFSLTDFADKIGKIQCLDGSGNVKIDDLTITRLGKSASDSDYGFPSVVLGGILLTRGTQDC